MIGDVRRTDSTKQDGVEFAELVGAVGRHHHAMYPVIVRTPVEVLEVQGEPAIALGADLQDLDAGLDHLGRDAITAHGSNLVLTHLFLLGAECFGSWPPSMKDSASFLERSGNRGLRVHVPHDHGPIATARMLTLVLRPKPTSLVREHHRPSPTR